MCSMNLRLLLGLLVASLSACGGSSMATVVEEPDMLQTTDGAATMGFGLVYERVFHDRSNVLQCTACHAFLGKELSQEELYDQLVNAPAEKDPCQGEMRIVP